MRKYDTGVAVLAGAALEELDAAVESTLLLLETAADEAGLDDEEAASDAAVGGTAA